MNNLNSQAQYFQQLSPRYIVPQHKNPRKIKLKKEKW